MFDYETVTEAIADLAHRGYTTDFKILRDQNSSVFNKTLEQLSPEDFQIDETYRFEGNSDPGDGMILFAISSKKKDLKGIVVDAYGMYSDADTSKIVELLLNKGTKPLPIKRNEILKPISREHHYGLLLCWKIREGFRLNVPPERIKNYTDWFWKNHLKLHFEFEEAYIFPILESDNKLIIRVLREHERLEALFTASDEIEKNLSFIEEELSAHIRFEERILFKEVEQASTEEQLKIIEKEHSKHIEEEWEDEFWAKKLT